MRVISVSVKVIPSPIPPVRPLKNGINAFCRASGLNPGPAVGQSHQNALLIFLTVDSHPAVHALLLRLNRIAEQIVQDLFQPESVRHHDRGIRSKRMNDRDTPGFTLVLQ